MPPAKKALNRRELEVKVAVLEERLRSSKRSPIAQNLRIVFNTFIISSAAVACVYFGYLAVLAVAGQQTDANIAIAFFGDITFATGTLVTTTISSVFWALKERSLKQDAIDHMHQRVKECEESLSPSRTSSNLTSRGTTNPRDM